MVQAAWGVTSISGMLYCWVEPCPTPRGGGPCHPSSHWALIINLQGRSINCIFQKILLDQRG